MYELILGSMLFILSLIIKNKVIVFITYFLLSYKLYINLIKNFKVDHQLLILLATLTSFIIGEDITALFMLLLYQIGMVLYDYQINDIERQYQKRLNVKTVHLKNKDITPNKVKKGDIITIKDGEVVPLDGTIVKGSASIDMKLIGLDKAIKVETNDYVLSGLTVIDGSIDIKVDKTLSESTNNKILEIVLNSFKTITKKEKLISKLVKIATFIIILIAMVLIIVPLVLNLDVKIWVNRAIICLIIFCPISLVTTVHFGHIYGIKRLYEKGILINGSDILESLTSIKTIIFNKTGIITKGIYKLEKVIPYKISTDELLSYAAYGEANSNHPIALAIKNKYGKKIDTKYIKDYKELPSLGVKAKINGDNLIIGNSQLFEKEKIVYPKIEFTSSAILVALNKTYIGTIVIGDKVKNECLNIASELKKINLKSVMLSSDDDDIVKKIGKKLSFDSAYGSLLKKQKLNKIETLKEDGNVIFIGDVNTDIEYLQASDIGVSLNTIDKLCNIVIMNDDPTKIIDAYNIAKITKKRVNVSIYLSLIIKILSLILGLIGLIPISVIVLINLIITVLSLLIYKLPNFNKY